MSTDTLVEVVVDVDLSLEPPCEGYRHPTGEVGHDGGPAKFLLRGFCPCGGVSVCAGRAVWFREHGTRCEKCNIHIDGRDVVLVEL